MHADIFEQKFILDYVKEMGYLKRNRKYKVNMFPEEVKNGNLRGRMFQSQRLLWAEKRFSLSAMGYHLSNNRLEPDVVCFYYFVTVMVCCVIIFNLYLQYFNWIYSNFYIHKIILFSNELQKYGKFLFSIWQDCL